MALLPFTWGFQRKHKHWATHRYQLFDNANWKWSPNVHIWASSVSITQDNFSNLAHKDVDASESSFGMFALVNRATGQHQQASKLPFSIHSVFNLTEYGVYVHFHLCDGVVEMVWNLCATHHTLSSVTKPISNYPYKPSPRIQSGQAPVTQFGSSYQISKKIVSLAKSSKQAKNKIWGNNLDSFLILLKGIWQNIICFTGFNDFFNILFFSSAFDLQRQLLALIDSLGEFLGTHIAQSQGGLAFRNLS